MTGPQSVLDRCDSVLGGAALDRLRALLILVRPAAVASPLSSVRGLARSMVYTSQISTPCFNEARGSLRLGMNSWAQNPLKPVSMMAFITAG